MRRAVRLAAHVMMALSLLAAPAAAEQDACEVTDGLVQAAFPMPYAAEAVAAKRLEVAVIGSASSVLAGKAGTGRAYPAQLEAALAAALPGVAVRVTTHAKSKQSASEQETTIGRLLAGRKPSLVVWQTGTVDAIRAIDPEEFRDALERGVETLQAQGVDVVLMNMQFSPRTETMISLGPYADQMRFVALQRSANLFDRLAVMKDWNERGTFDLSVETRKIDMAADVHACIGRLLARLVVEGIALPTSGQTAE
jgi:hypothetical protein